MMNFGLEWKWNDEFWVKDPKNKEKDQFRHKNQCRCYTKKNKTSKIEEEYRKVYNYNETKYGRLAVWLICRGANHHLKLQREDGSDGKEKKIEKLSINSLLK